MKKYWVWISLCISWATWAQEDAWVYFIDKPQATIYVNQPQLMLSERALARRQRCQVAVDLNDVPLETSYVNTVKNWPNIQVLAHSKWLNALHVRALTPDIQSLAQLPFVGAIRFANHNLAPILKPVAQHPPTPIPRTLQRSSLPYGASEVVMNQLGASCLHEAHFTGQGMLIGVLDNGFTGADTHPAFTELMATHRVLDTYDFVHRTASVYSSGSHGTMVLSAMAAKADHELIGTACNAQYALYTTEDTASEQPLEESLWVEAAERADSLGVDVLNTSLGYRNFDNSAYNHPYSELDGQTTFIARGLEIAWSRGIICVVAAGNDGQTNPPSLSTPADAPHALTIGAVDSNGQWASFSSNGPNAAGVLKPDIMAPGVNITVANSNGGYTQVNGTSLSTPEITGLMACLWQSQPQLTHQAVRDIVIQSSSNYLTANTQMGYGIPNFCTAFQLSSKISKRSAFQTWPNPTSQFWQVIAPEQAAPIRYTLWNHLGQKIFDGQSETSVFHIDVSPLSPGIYQVIWELNHQTSHSTLIKQ